MCPTHRSGLLAPLAALALLATLLATLLWPVAAAQAARGQTPPTTTPARHSRYTMIYGYLTDPKPSTDGTLYVYSKTHKTTFHVVMTSSTAVKVHTQVVHRAALVSGLYVIVTCLRQKDGTLRAVTVHIELHHRSARKH